jgi:hypothetical protein
LEEAGGGGNPDPKPLELELELEEGAAADVDVNDDVAGAVSELLGKLEVLGALLKEEDEAEPKDGKPKPVVGGAAGAATAAVVVRPVKLANALLFLGASAVVADAPNAMARGFDEDAEEPFIESGLCVWGGRVSG